MYDPPKPLPIKNRISFAFLEKGRVDVKDGAFVLIDKNGIRTQIPIGSITCLMLEPGIRITHAAVDLAAKTGSLLIWVGEAGVRVYSAGQPGGARADKLLWQAASLLDEKARLNIVRFMFEKRFKEKAPLRRSVRQLQGIEGARVREMYKQFGALYGVKWKGRKYDPKDWDKADAINRALSTATSCLYGITEAAILAAGYSPALGFIHTGKPRSFVFDIADIYKFDTVVPVAFSEAKKGPQDISGRVRRSCRDVFREKKILRRLIPDIEEILKAGGLEIPKPGSDQIAGKIPTEKTGDDGHRS